MLTHLLAAIFHWPDTHLSLPFKANCQLASFYLLRLSHLLARRFGYTRYQQGTASEEALFIPEARLLEQLKTNAIVTRATLQRLVPGGPMPAWLASEFTFTAAEFRANNNTEDSLLLQKPLMQLGEDCLIVSPLTMSYALTDFIWRQAAQWGCAKELREAYRSLIWNNLQVGLEHLGFYDQNAPDALLAVGTHIKAGLYRFDEDKIALVSLVSSYGPADQKGKTSTELLTAIMALPEYVGYKVLDLQVGSREDRDLMLMLSTGSETTKSLVISVEEFDALVALDDADAIDLWKFAVAKYALFTRTHQPMLSVSFLDEFKVYRENEDSFYVSDEARADQLHFLPGYAADLLAKAKLTVDFHSVPLSIGGQQMLFPVRRLVKYGPIYYNVNDKEEGRLRYLVEGFDQPIWIEPVNMSQPVSRELRGWFRQITEAIAYWLWQIQDGLKPFLHHQYLDAVYVKFECQPLASFADIERNYTRTANLADCFQTSATASTILVTIPAEILPYLYGADNEGERELVRQLLRAINKLLTVNSYPLIPPATIIAILEKFVPLGMKKKVYLLDSSDNLLLDPRYLVAKRTVQEYDISIVLDSLVPALEELGVCPPVGDLATKVEKRQLIDDIVLKVLLPKLRRTMSRYDQRDLLIKLLALNETLIYHRERLRINTPTRIACFVGHEQQVQEIKEIQETASTTSIAIRCLIEHLSAEQTTHGARASTTDMDELVAIMSQIMAWGSLDDQLYFDLFDIPMGILPTQRIATGKLMVREVLEPYHTAKAREDVSDAIRLYQQVFPQQNPQEGSPTPDFLNEAFLTDFGISFNRLCEFMNALIELALQAETSTMAVPKAKLVEQMAQLGYAFDAAEFETALNYLTLIKRDNPETPPPGYEFIDMLSWRFSRRLSLLAKPIVAFHNSADELNPTLHWGFRQLLTSRIYLGDQVLAGRMRVPKGGAMEKALGTIADAQGKPLVRKIAARLTEPDNLVDTDVGIKPKGKLRNVTDLGDVDVLVINQRLKMLFSLECKNMSPSRNIKEMVEELQRLLGPPLKKAWVLKHLTRHEWLTQNLAQIGQVYGLDLMGFTVRSFMVTTEGMLTPYLKKQDLPMQFLTAYEVERRGLEALLNPEALEDNVPPKEGTGWQVLNFSAD